MIFVCSVLGVGVGVGELEGEALGVTVGVGAGELEGEALGVTVGVGAGELEGEALGVTVGVGFVTTFTPLLQTNFLPDLTQVNLYPLTVDVDFNLVQVPPAFAVAATARLDGRKVARRITRRADASRRI